MGSLLDLVRQRQHQSAYLTFDGRDLYFSAVLHETTEHSATVTEHPVEDTGSDVADHIRDGLDKVTLEVKVTNHPIDEVARSLYGGSIEGVELTHDVLEGEPLGTTLDVPKYRPVPPTPGGLMQAIGSAVQDLFTGESYKVPGNQVKVSRGTSKATVLTWPSPFDAVRDTVTTLLQWKENGVIGQVILPYKSYESMVIERVTVTRTSETGDAADLSIELKEIRLVESQMVSAALEPMGEKKKAKGRQGTTVRETPKKKSLMAKFTR